MVGIRVVTTFRPMVHYHRIVCVPYQDLDRRVMVQRTIRIRMARHHTVVGLVPRYSICLWQRVGALMARTSVKAWRDLKDDLSNCVAIFSFLRIRTSSVRIDGLVDVSSIPVQGRSFAVQRVRGTRQLSCGLVRSVIMSTIRSHAIRSNRDHVLHHASVFSFVRATRQRRFIPLRDCIYISVRLRILNPRKNSASERFHSAIPRKTRVDRRFIVNGQEGASVVRVRRVPYFKGVVVRQRRRTISMRSRIRPHVRDQLSFPFRVQVSIFRTLVHRREQISRQDCPIEARRHRNDVQVGPSLVSYRSMSRSRLRIVGRIGASRGLLANCVPHYEGEERCTPFVVPSGFKEYVHARIRHRRMAIVMHVVRASRRQRRVQLFVVKADAFPEARYPTLRAIVPRLVKERVDHNHVGTLGAVLLRLPWDRRVRGIDSRLLLVHRRRISWWNFQLPISPMDLSINPCHY